MIPTCFILSGPSGVGKGTVVKELLRSDPSIRLSISKTTRPPREGEVDGVHYHFISRETFLTEAAQDGFLESAQYGEHLYGTPRAGVEEEVERGNTVLLEIECVGAAEVRKTYKGPLVSIFLRAPLPVIESRLRHRATESEEKIEARLRQAKEELSRVGEFTFVVENGRDNEGNDRDLGEVVGEILGLITATRMASVH